MWVLFEFYVRLSSQRESRCGFPGNLWINSQQSSVRPFDQKMSRSEVLGKCQNPSSQHEWPSGTAWHMPASMVTPNWYQGSGSAVFFLKAGEHWECEICEMYMIHHKNHNTFTGFTGNSLHRTVVAGCFTWIQADLDGLRGTWKSQTWKIKSLCIVKEEHLKDGQSGRNG